MKEQFKDFDFKPATMAVIQTANSIMEEYRAQGFKLTLRQLYYQFVSRDLLDNKQTEYKRLGSIVNDARLAGLLDWSMIEDRTRFLRSHSSWDNPADIIRSAAFGYQEDLWATQDNYVEVWIEKDALVGVIEGVCDELQVPYFACRGYPSQSELYDAGKRFAAKDHDGKQVHVIHLGDHDPSGIDMTRDIDDRLSMFAETYIEVNRIALNRSQVDRYNPPPNPAKLTDSRATGYISEHGYDSWELDALEPRVIASLIRDEVQELIDQIAWSEAEEEQQANADRLKTVASNWEAFEEKIDELREEDE